MPAKLHVGDTVTFIVRFRQPDPENPNNEEGIAFPIDLAESRKISIEYDGGDAVEFDAGLLTDGKDGAATYTTVNDGVNADLHTKGYIYIQGIAKFSDGQVFHTERERRRVYPNNKAPD